VILATKTLRAIDKAIESKQGDGFREHLGASLIGKECPRYIWYVWRWAKRAKASARLLRLWDRGNREEERYVQWYRNAGIHVEPLDLVTMKQFRIEDYEGHFGGSLDARLFDPPEFPMQWVLGEFKTFAEKYFKELVKSGVQKSQPGYYVQMQVYMHYMNLQHALFNAINKNDDTLHIEIIEYDRASALHAIERAGRIIEMQVPPARINESPGYYICRMCDMYPICHNGDPMAQNCRTCVNSRPIDKGRWICVRFNYILSKAEQKRGCQDYTQIPD
jgi:hypothetical protein